VVSFETAESFIKILIAGPAVSLRKQIPNSKTCAKRLLPVNQGPGGKTEGRKSRDAVPLS
jgi:hypothetical protein